MSVLSKLRGTIETFFQIGGTGGSGWNLNGAVLEAKNAANNALVIVRGLTPAIATDLVTKAYADALALTGDVTGTVGAAVVGKLQGTVVLSGAAANGTALTATAANAATWTALPTALPPNGAAGGDLGGTYPNPTVRSVADVTTGVLPVANQAAQTMVGDVGGTTAASTVAKVNGTSVNAGGALTTGQLLRATGAAAATWGAVDLTNASAVAGLLPVANQAAQTMVGDVGGTTAASVVNAITGGVSGTVTSTTPFKVSANSASGSIGSGLLHLVLNNTSTTGQTQLVFENQGTVLGGLVADYTGNLKFGSSNALVFYTNLAETQPALSMLSGNLRLFANQSTSYEGGGSGVMGVKDATTIPSTTVAGGLALYSNSGAFELNAGGFQFHPLTTPTIRQQAGTTDVASAPMSILAQGASSGATGAHQNGASLTLKSGAPVGAGTAGIVLLGDGSNRGYVQINNGVVLVNSYTNTQFGTAAGVTSGTGTLVLSNASTNPTTNPTGGVAIYSENTSGHFKCRGTLGGVTTMAAAGSSGTINSQKQIDDVQIGTCETVSSGTPTAILAYPTVSGAGGLMTIRCVSRATTAGSGIAVGNTSSATYEVAYQNIGGTVTLDTTGLTLQGTARTTASALTSPVLTASVATNVITILVANAALCTVDSQVIAKIASC